MDLDDDACYRAISTRDARFDGRLFVGVKTTGIYCRPICPARVPKRENTKFYSTAASAHEAGFRPCLRCRPEAAPDLAAWNGTSSTVSRALALIETGAMDGGDVAGLADRLGVGERQLRRLFRRHIGASPITVAQTRRVLLAKQLIHETKLPMTEVALAAGFGSVRRFNQTFQQLYDRAPKALRRGTAADVSSSSAGSVTIRLAYRPPYDWPAMLDFLRRRCIAGVELIVADAYARTIELDGAHGVVVVQSTTENALQARITFPKLSSLPAIIGRLRRVFDLAADPAAIGSHLAKDTALAALIRARPGLRVPGAWDGFELAVRALLGERNSASAGLAHAERLVTALGCALRVGHPDYPSLTHVFPNPERIAEAELSDLGIPEERAAALAALAAAVVADPKIFGARRSLDEAIAQLRTQAGAGEWTAQYIAMRELREPDAFPAADSGLMRAMEDSTGCRLDSNELLVRAERWRPWRAYAAEHLWSSRNDRGAD